MRTKTLLLTAALTAAGVATSMAQVYSVNMVGYINVPIGVGYNMVANQLNNSPNNMVVTLFPAPPEETAVYKYNRGTGGFDILTYLAGEWGGDDIAMTLGPGEGAFISTLTAFTQTFVGEVQLSSSVTINPGYQIVSSVIPQSLPLDGLANDGSAAAPVGLGFVPQEEDTIYQYNRATSGFIINSFLAGEWGGDTGNPVPAVSEAFWVSRVASAPVTTWTRNFVVGVD